MYYNGQFLPTCTYRIHVYSCNSMLTDDPSDQLVSAVEDYHSEHLSLSQGLSQSQHNQGYLSVCM